MRATSKRVATAADPSVLRLQSLLASQKRALQTNDPATIAEATRPLVADLLREAAKLHLVEAKPVEAADLYRKSLAFQESPEIRLELASTLLRSGRPQDAASEAATVLALEPKSASAWAVRGSALRSVGDDKGAVEAFRQSLEVHSDVNVAYALASSLLALHEKEKAASIFQQIIAGSGNAAIWHVAAGDAYREARYLNDAVEEFKKAIAIDPRVGHSEFFLGLTYLQLNEWGPNSQSFEHLNAAVRLAPHDHISNFYLGALESTVGSDLASSDRHLHAAAEADPTSPETWLYLGLNAAHEKNTSEAKAYLRKAVELTGSNEERNNYQIRRVYAVLGRILISEGNHAEGDALLAKYKRTEQQAIANSAAVITQSAEADLARSAISGTAAAKASFPGMNTSVSPEQGVAAGERTSQVSATRSPEESRRLATSEQQIGELLAESFNDLGTAEARQGNYQLALAHFQEAEHWQAPTPILLHNLGIAAFRTGDFSESARALGLYLRADRKTEASPDRDDRSRTMLAMSLFSLGNFAEADKAFASSSAITMDDPRAAYSWAYSLAHSGGQQHANEIAESLETRDLPSDVMSLVCHLFVDTEDYKQSVACFRKAYQADPNLKLAHYQVAESLIRLDRPEEAVPELKQELALNPDNPDVQYSLAFALLQSSHKYEAMAILQALTALHPEHAQAQYQMGKTLLESGEIPEAVNHLELAEKSDPAPDYIHYQLQAAYRKAGRTQDAERELQLYRDIKARNRAVTPVSH